MADLTIEKAAGQMGVTVPTLSRIERGGAMDGKTLATILGWLMGAKS